MAGGASLTRILNKKSGADSAGGLLMGVGTSAAPATNAVANKHFFEFRVQHTATSGDNRGIYLRTEFGGAAGGGDGLRVNTVMTEECGTVNGLHGSLSCNTGGSITGLGTGIRAGLLFADAAMTGGTYAALQVDLWANGASTDISGVTEASAIRVAIGGNATGAGNLEDNANLLVITGGTNASSNLVSAAGNEPTWTSNTYLIRCSLNSQTAYLVAVKV